MKWRGNGAGICRPGSQSNRWGCGWWCRDANHHSGLDKRGNGLIIQISWFLSDKAKYLIVFRVTQSWLFLVLGSVALFKQWGSPWHAILLIVLGALISNSFPPKLGSLQNSWPLGACSLLILARVFASLWFPNFEFSENVVVRTTIDVLVFAPSFCLFLYSDIQICRKAWRGELTPRIQTAG